MKARRRTLGPNRVGVLACSVVLALAGAVLLDGLEVRAGGFPVSTSGLLGATSVAVAPSCVVTASVAPGESVWDPASSQDMFIDLMVSYTTNSTCAGQNVTGNVHAIADGSIMSANSTSHVVTVGENEARAFMLTLDTKIPSNIDMSSHAYALVFQSASTFNGESRLTPEFGGSTSTEDGFTVQVSNYDGAFTWAGTSTSGGSVAVSDTGLVTVAGVAPGTSATARITTTRTGYTGGIANVTGSSIVGSALTPEFGLTTATSDGFSVQVSNFDGAFAWAGTATAGGIVVVSETGLVTVTGVAASSASTATITTARLGYVSGSTEVTATSL